MDTSEPTTVALHPATPEVTQSATPLPQSATTTAVVGKSLQLNDSVCNTVVMRSAPQGGLLRTGNPGNVGGHGRPASKFLAELHALPDRAKIAEVVEDVIQGRLEGVSASDRMRAIEYVSDRVLGKAVQPVAVAGELTFHLVRE